MNFINSLVCKIRLETTGTEFMISCVDIFSAENIYIKRVVSIKQ